MDQGVCCRQLVGLRRVKSPFTRVIAFDYADGPRAGLAQCGHCGRAFRFEPLDELINGPDGRDVRIVSLAPLPATSLDAIVAALSESHEPGWPVWAPIWRFSSEAERAVADDRTQRILDEASPAELVIAATDHLAEEILACRGVTSEQMSRVDDWFAFLGLTRARAAV
jgi:hypothetical protein